MKHLYRLTYTTGSGRAVEDFDNLPAALKRKEQVEFNLAWPDARLETVDEELRAAR